MSSVCLIQQFVDVLLSTKTSVYFVVAVVVAVVIVVVGGGVPDANEL